LLLVVVGGGSGGVLLLLSSSVVVGWEGEFGDGNMLKEYRINGNDVGYI
jgi:hypothetical protein